MHFAPITCESSDSIIDNTMRQGNFSSCGWNEATTCRISTTHNRMLLIAVLFRVLLLRASWPFLLKSVHACLHHQSHDGGTPRPYLPPWMVLPTLWKHRAQSTSSSSIQCFRYQLDFSTCNVFSHPTLLPKLNVQVSVQSHFPIPCLVVVPSPSHQLLA